LDSNIYGNKSDGICITINASNVTIDCAGHNITGKMGYGNLTIGIGNYDARSNVTIKNCYITGYTFGIYVNLSNKYNITNNSLIKNGKAGIFLDSTENSTIWYNYINDTWWTEEDPGEDFSEFCNWSAPNFYRFEGGIILCSSNYTTISYNYIKGNGTCLYDCISNHNGAEGIFTYNSKLNNITYNIFRNSGDNYDSLFFYSYDTNYRYNDQNGTDPSTGNWNVNDGIKLDNSRGFNISHSNFSNNYEWGIFLVYSNDSYIYNNLVHYNKVGIRLGGYSSSNTITNNTANNNTNYGIYLSYSSNNNITNNIVNNNNWRGIYLYFSSHNIMRNNTAKDNAEWDFYSYDSLDNVVINLDLGSTIASFEGEDIALKKALSPGGEPLGNIGKYVNATATSTNSWLYLNISYTDSELGNVIESTLKMWKYNGSWYQINESGVDTANNYVYSGNIIKFSIFAPLGEVSSGGGEGGRERRKRGGGSGCFPITQNLSVKIEKQDRIMANYSSQINVSIKNNANYGGEIEIEIENNCSRLEINKSQRFWINGKEEKNLSFEFISYEKENCSLSLIIKNCGTNKTLSINLEFFIPECGNSVCEENENYTNCCVDCGCPLPYICIENECKLEQKPQPPSKLSFKSPVLLYSVLVGLLILIIILIILLRIFKKRKQKISKGNETLERVLEE
jgi:parallel beta-helix repeat protein